ncbi:hypothetical protein Nepgr_015800 [Nepenthes gracilis]|uniref:Uncharacterized protein n=1 Tax=Nepenthes gracilis TaxID=150966 RepID=A0AAD3SNL4_NEPGR|nr:hypothetical protein Nepgr_015800 [Nepenthes gracilis]
MLALELKEILLLYGLMLMLLAATALSVDAAHVDVLYIELLILLKGPWSCMAFVWSWVSECGWPYPAGLFMCGPVSIGMVSADAEDCCWDRFLNFGWLEVANAGCCTFGYDL